MNGKRRNDAANNAYKYRLYPNDDQRLLIAKTFGCCRYYWNAIIEDTLWIHEETGSWIDTPRPAEYKRIASESFLKEVDSNALCNVQLAYEQALRNHFKNPSHFGLPTFHARQGLKGSYKTNMVIGTNRKTGEHTYNIELVENGIKLPKLGWVKVNCHRPLPEGARIKNVTVSRESNGDYYVSVGFYDPQLEAILKENDIQPMTDSSVLVATALDYSSASLFVNEAGIHPEQLKAYTRNLKRIRRLSRQVSRKQKGSNNYHKAQARLNKLHRRIARQREDFLHKVSCALARVFDVVCIEDLNLRGIANSKFRLGRSTYDNAWGMFVRLLGYKLRRKGGLLVKVGRFYPSSKVCHHCGAKFDGLTLDMREWVCPECHTELDRDVNAAWNILTEGLRILCSGEHEGVEPGVFSESMFITAGGTPVSGESPALMPVEGRKTWRVLDSKGSPVEAGIKELYMRIANASIAV